MAEPACCTNTRILLYMGLPLIFVYMHTWFLPVYHQYIHHLMLKGLFKWKHPWMYLDYHLTLPHWRGRCFLRYSSCIIRRRDLSSRQVAADGKWGGFPHVLREDQLHLLCLAVGSRKAELHPQTPLRQLVQGLWLNWCHLTSSKQSKSHSSVLVGYDNKTLDGPALPTSKLAISHPFGEPAFHHEHLPQGGGAENKVYSMSLDVENVNFRIFGVEPGVMTLISFYLFIYFSCMIGFYFFFFS